MRRLGAVALVALAGLAGCLGGGSEDLAQTGTDPSQDLERMFAFEAPERVEMTGCTEHRAIVPFPVSPLPGVELPDGFTSRDLVYFFGRDCPSATNLSGASPTFVQFGLAVRPPNDLARQDAVTHLLDIGNVHHTAEGDQTFDAWNLHGAQGQVSLETLVEADTARVGHTRSQNGGFVIDVHTEVAGPTESLSSEVVRVFATEDGNVTNAVDMTATQGQVLEGSAEVTIRGTGSLVVPPPGEAGPGYQIGGEDYGITYTYVPLGNATG